MCQNHCSESGLNVFKIQSLTLSPEDTFSPGGGVVAGVGGILDLGRDYCRHFLGAQYKSIHYHMQALSYFDSLLLNCA